MNVGGVRFASVDGKGDVSFLARSTLFAEIVVVRTRRTIPVGDVEDGLFPTPENERIESY